MRARPGAVKGAPPEAVLEALLRREPPAGPSRWQAFSVLRRQPWHPAAADERGLRVVSSTLSFLLHVVFVVGLALLMHTRFAWMDAPAESGEHVVEVTFIGDGTPDEEGGAAPATQDEQDEQAAAQETPAVPPQPVREPVLPPPAVASREPETPAAPPPPAEQPLEVTQTPQPDTSFVLPPPRPPELPAARVRDAEVAPRLREIEVVELRDPAMPQVRQAEVPVPDLEQPRVEVREREIAAPLPRPGVPEVAAPTIEAPELRSQAQQVRSREVPMPARPVPAPAAQAGAGATAATPDAGTSRAAEADADADGRRPEAAAPGTGTAQAPGAGARPTPQPGDDWGLSDREQPGGQAGSAGLFNPDGSPRLAEGTGRVGGGLPPGTLVEDYERIDRMGTWLRRPPTDYEPTSFDRFWVPHENLLQEWVRRSVRTVLIPIPGTNKTIRCDVVTLAVAGGCGISDSNLRDNPAQARPPPDVPFRPELQEDQEGLSDDAWR